MSNPRWFLLWAALSSIMANQAEQMGHLRASEILNATVLASLALSAICLAWDVGRDGVV